MARIVGICAGAAVALAALGAYAQPKSDVAATALFDEGRKLMEQKKYAEACPKFAESQKLAPSGGTLINLAECYEKNGQTASAWSAWKEAAARANTAGKGDVEQRALSRAGTLEPNLAKLTIVVAPASDVPGLEVKRDGAAIGHAELGVAIPVDPGSHTVEAAAPKKKPWSTKVDVAAKQNDARVMVSLADDLDAAGAGPVPTAGPVPVPTQGPPRPEQPAPAAGSTQKTIGIVLVALGAVGVGVGSYFGLQAKSKNDEALQNCRTSTLCTQTGVDDTNDAKSAATISTFAFGAGAVALGAGLVLWLTSPSSSPAAQPAAAAPAPGALRVAPMIGPSVAGVSLGGAL